MRENRTYGSEGGESGQPDFPTPMCASERTASEWCKSTPEWRHESVTDCNCVATRRGGEQQEVKGQSAVKRTRFGQALSASLRSSGEAQN